MSQNHSVPTPAAAPHASLAMSSPVVLGCLGASLGGLLAVAIVLGGVVLLMWPRRAAA
ncbi:MAG: hypothetical protein KGL25_07455 [Gammaproteobacteria bacterium]|nr:hypothetical protein [Gammaproteobacteria bacterium]MDE2251226.1 hypothetical protein [Gammaproteobacteria bacterium]